MTSAAPNRFNIQYMEQLGSALVTNMYLRVAVLCLSVVAVGALLLNFKTYSLFRNFKPLVIRINDVGRAEPLQYSVYGAIRLRPRDKYVSESRGFVPVGGRGRRPVAQFQDLLPVPKFQAAGDSH